MHTDIQTNDSNLKNKTTAPSFRKKLLAVIALWSMPAIFSPVPLTHIEGLQMTFFYPLGLFIIFFAEYFPEKYTLVIIGFGWMIYIALTVTILRASTKSRFLTRLTILALVLLCTSAGCNKIIAGLDSLKD